MRIYAFTLCEIRIYNARMICTARQEHNFQSAAIFRGMTISDLTRRLQIAGKKRRDLAEFLDISYHSAGRLERGERAPSFEEVQKLSNWIGEYPDEIAKPKHIVPVYGFAANWEDDEYISFAPDKAIEWVDNRYKTLTQSDIFIVRAIGDTMRPRYFAGDEAIVAKDLPPACGKDCLIEFKDQTAVIKTYEKQQGGMVFARQYNPEKLCQYPVSSIRQIHTILLRR